MEIKAQPFYFIKGRVIHDMLMSRECRLLDSTNCGVAVLQPLCQQRISAILGRTAFVKTASIILRDLFLVFFIIFDFAQAAKATIVAANWERKLRKSWAMKEGRNRKR